MEMCNRCLEQNTNLTIKGKKRKHFTDVVKNMVFSQTVKNIHLSVVLRIEFFFCAERKKKKCDIVEMYKMTTYLRIQCTSYIYQWAITIINKYGLPTCKSPIVSSSFLRKFNLFRFFFNTKYFWKYTVIYNTYVFWSCFLLSTFQILIFLKSILYTAKYKKKSPKEDCLPLSVKHQILKHNIRAITKKLADTAILTRVTWISQMFFLCSKRIRGNNWEST